MRYEDRTVDPFTVKKLSLLELIFLLREETGRELVITSNWKECCQYFALVRMPAPLGFLIVANCDIEKDTILPSSYGGEKLPLAKEKLIRNSEFLARMEYVNGQDGEFFQAEKSGDLGTLFAHLPDRAFLDTHRFCSEDIASFQLENCKLKMIDSDHFVFVATNDIQKGAIIGQSYGLNYWLTVAKSPCLFYQNTLDIVDLSQYSFSVVCGAKDHRGGMLVGRDGGLCFSFFVDYFEALTKEILKGESGGTIALDGDHHFRGQFIRFVMSQMLLDVVVTAKDFEKDLMRQVDPITTKPNGLFFFFTARAVVSSCNPPPGSTVDEEGRTVVARKVN